MSEMLSLTREGSTNNEVSIKRDASEKSGTNLSINDSDMDLGLLDLNLLIVFDALMPEHNLTRAGRRIGLSQPAASHALGKLCQMLHDDLWIHTPESMQPTPHAEEMAEPVGDALRMLSIALKAGSFDPSNATRGFSIAVNHYASRAVVPALARNVSDEAPRVSLDVRSLGPVDKPILAAARPGRLGLHDTHVATGVTR